MRTIEKDIVSAVIISSDEKILHALQDEHGPYPGCWGLIGGGVEEGETKREALNREVLEETGIDISEIEVELVHESEGEAIKKLRQTGEEVHMEMQFYTYKVLLDKDADDIEVVLSEEHPEYKWFSPSEIKDTKITPPSVGLFTALGYL